MKQNENLLRNGMYGLVIKRLEELNGSSNGKSGVIRFPSVFSKLCRNFSMDKEQAWELLFLFKDLGFIEIVPFQGIKMKHQEKNNQKYIT